MHSQGPYLLTILDRPAMRYSLSFVILSVIQLNACLLVRTFASGGVQGHTMPLAGTSGQGLCISHVLRRLPRFPLRARLRQLGTPAQRMCAPDESPGKLAIGHQPTSAHWTRP